MTYSDLPQKELLLHSIKTPELVIGALFHSILKFKKEKIWL